MDNEKVFNTFREVIEILSGSSLKEVSGREEVREEELSKLVDY